MVRAKAHCRLQWCELLLWNPHLQAWTQAAGVRLQMGWQSQKRTDNAATYGGQLKLP